MIWAVKHLLAIRTHWSCGLFEIPRFRLPGESVSKVVNVCSQRSMGSKKGDSVDEISPNEVDDCNDVC